MKLDTALYDKIFEKIKPLLRTGRPGDFAHIKSVYRLMIDYCQDKKYRLDPRIALPAAILHDCGYGFIKKKFMRLFTGHAKIASMKDAVNRMTLAYVPAFLREFGFTEKEINGISLIIQYSDEDTVSVQNPSIELQILHDLNLYDRFLPHRVKTLRILYPDKAKTLSILERALEYIILPEIKDKAAHSMKKLRYENR